MLWNAVKMFGDGRQDYSKNRKQKPEIDLLFKGLNGGMPLMVDS